MRHLTGGEILLSREEVVGLPRILDRERARSREAQRVFEQLAPREKDVLGALAEGMGDKEIA